ncbi:aminomethyl-transferring glycine dehydrogenase subunit GcvPA [Candidatus Sumerlaeota bacterium]|nr:aminomethyl-transferring glycine dehydrogenase subunit GcvPA [Candidatus Sumerlaeota bacterium]
MNTHPFLPQTPEQVESMLTAIGCASIDELYRDVPEHLLLREAPALPPALSETDLVTELQRLTDEHPSDPRARAAFPLGGGWEPHASSALVHRLATLPPFLTAYTPYQAEASQGILQAFHEFQTMIAALLGCEIANASLYDGATGLAEAAFMAGEITSRGKNRRERAVVSETVAPHARAVMQSYFDAAGWEMVTIPQRGGTSDIDRVRDAIDERTCALVMAHPNFFGGLEDLRPVAELAHGGGALLVAMTEPSVLGIIESPGAMGADVVVADGCSLGLTPFAGGDTLGLFACRKDFIRKVPGRLVGTTKDSEGRRAHTLTLQTREQHIRREKATSNICTNQGLHALRAAIHLICLGPQGLREIGLATLAAAQAARAAANEMPGVEIAFDTPSAQSFVVTGQSPHLGLPLERWYPDLTSHFLVTASELTTAEQVKAWKEAVQ